MGTIGLPDTIPNKYTGPEVNLVPIRFFPHRPVVGNKKFPVGQMVILQKNPTTGLEGELWYLSKFTSGNPIWLPLTSGTSGPTISLSDTAGTQVLPTALGNIQLEGTAGITVTADPGSNKLVLALGGGGTAVDSIAVDAATGPGTNPVLPTAAGVITITGGQIANAGLANVIRSNSLSANAFTIQIQQAGAAAATNSTKNGVAHFNSSHFTLGADAFVSSQTATTSQIGIVTLASQAQSEYNTYGTTQVLQSGNIAAMLAKPAPIGSSTPNTGAFTTCSATGATDQFVILTAAITGTGTNVENTSARLFYRTTTVGAAGLGNIVEFFLYNAAGSDTEFSQLVTVIDTATAAAETGHFRIDVKTAGTTAPSCRFYGDRVELQTSSRLRLGSGGIDFMSGAGDPNGAVTAAKGSYYARTDGSSTSTRAYINTDGATAWTSVTTAT